MLDYEVRTEVEIGKVADYYAIPGVASFILTGPLKLGDVVRIRGNQTDMEVPVTSMQINNRDVSAATTGDSIGLKVPGRVKRGDAVYQVLERD